MEEEEEDEGEVMDDMQRPRLKGRCNRCRKVAPLTRHHVVPRSEGGGDDEDNIELVCRACHDAIHRTRPRRTTNKAVRVARRARIKVLRSQVDFKCRPRLDKCKNCNAICMNFVIELLLIFFRWLDEVTREAYEGALTEPEGLTAEA